MSLKEKLLAKKNQKKAEKQEAEAQSLQEKITGIDVKIEEVKAKKERIATLTQQLKNHYDLAGKDIDAFKGKKEDLHAMYEDNKEMLGDEGIKSVKEMINVNSEEEEVVDYREASKKGKEKVANISDVKVALKEELPEELNIKFTGGKKGEEEMSNRDLAFLAIDKYLEDLEQEMVNLDKEKENVHLETPEGKRKELMEKINVSGILRAADSERVANFQLSSQEMKLGEQYGEELVKDVIKEELKSKMEKQAFYGKSDKAQEAVKSYDMLRNIVDLKGIDREIVDAETLRLDAENHLKAIFSDNEEIREAVNAYGFGGDDTAQKYLNHITRLSGLEDGSLGAFDNLKKQYKDNQNKIRSRDFMTDVDSPEYYSKAFENYTKVYRYIINNVDKDTRFVGKNSEDEDDLMHEFNKENDNEEESTREKTGIEELSHSRKKIPLPQGHLNTHKRSFDKAYSEAQKEHRLWEDEKKAIASVSDATVEMRWAEKNDQYYREENKEVIQEIESSWESLKSQGSYIDRLDYYLSEEDKEREVRVEEGKSLVDVTAEKDKAKYEEKVEALQTEKDEYINGLVTSGEKVIEDIGSGVFANLQKKKREKAQNRVDYLKGYLGQNFEKVDRYSEEVLKHIKEEEAEKLTAFYHEKVVLDSDYKDVKEKGDSLRIKTDSTAINIKNSLSIYRESMTVTDFIERSKKAMGEVREYLNSLPEKKQEIRNQANKNEELVKETVAKYEAESRKYKR